MKKFLDKLRETGFFHIFSSQVLIKIVSFCSGFFIIRLLSRSEYGIYTNSNTVLTTFLLLTGLGTASAMLQFGSESYKDSEKKNSFLNYGFRIGMVFNSIMVIAIIIYALSIMPLYDSDSKPFLLLLAFMPIVAYLNDVISTNLRIDLRNKAYSYFNTASTILLFVATVGGAVIGRITGVIALRYTAYAIVLLLAILINKDLFSFLHCPINLIRNEKILFVKISVISAINNGISQLLNVIDTLLVGIILKNNLVTASYGTGSLIPTALLFIPQSVMVYVYPYFARHSNDIAWVKKQYFRLFKIMLVFSLAITVVLYFLVPPIVTILFTDKYKSCIDVFRILLISFFFSSAFRMPSCNILVTQKKVKINFYLAVASGVLNIILDIILIKAWGAMGAAIATLCVNIFSGACSTIYLQVYLTKRTKFPSLPQEN